MLGLQKMHEKETISSPSSNFYARCSNGTAGTVAMEKLGNGVETVKGFRYLGDIHNASGSFEAALMVRTRTGCVKFRECGQVLYLWQTFPTTVFSGL